MPQFNAELLVLARDLHGFTQSDLALALNVSQGEISKIEAGIRPPSDELLIRIAKLLKCPVEFFFLTDPVRNFGSSCVYHRKRQSTPQKMLDQLLALVNKRRIQIKRLLQSVEVTDNLFPRLDVDDYAEGPAHIARMLRSAWKLPPGPIHNLTDAIEGAGGLVLRCDFGTNKVDAFSQWLPDLPPLFFINGPIPADRVRFSLAHEIGHIVMHQLPTDNMEREADQFAAELLMPSASIASDLAEISLPRLAALKPKWKVSMAALLKRSGDLGLIDSRRKDYLWFKMGSLGYRTKEPVVISHESPALLSEIVTRHREELGYSVAELAKLMVCTEEEVRAEFISNKAGFKLHSS